MAESAFTAQALCLLSGSLDSQLAVSLLQEQGVGVRGVVFTSPFFDTADARQAARDLAIPLRAVPIGRAMVKILAEHMQNGDRFEPPCHACRTQMFNLAGDLLEEEGCSFIATGEILSQRCPSQSLDELVESSQSSRYDGYILRPLCAQLLPETMPEKKGWVDRSGLLAFQGRCRKELEDLAALCGLGSYPEHTGLCRLMQEEFVLRVRDAMQHEGLSGSRALGLIGMGRHFRLGELTKLVVGRNEHENASIEGSAELYDIVLKLEETPGPTGLLPSHASEDEIGLAAAICARYGDCHSRKPVRVRLRSPNLSRTMEIMPAESAAVDKYRI